MRRLLHKAAEMRRDTRGTALVELAVVLPLFFLLLFGIFEYGRLYWNVTMSQKAMQTAARLASVGPPQCAGLPSTHTVSGSAPANTQYGTLCRSGGVCAAVATTSCALNTGTAYGARIWSSIAPLLPPGATAEHVRFTYTQDPQLGFLGGPYTPVVTAGLTGLNFDFVLPVGALAAMAANDPSLAAGHPASIAIPSMSTSLPAEDLASGVAE